MFLGIAPRTYSNVEASPWKVIGRDRAERLAEVYELGAADRAELLAAWERCPLSPYGERRRERFESQRARRSVVKHYPRLQLSLVEVVSLLLAQAQGRPLCTCLFGGGTEYDAKRSCEFCEAIDALGIPPRLDEPRMYERLAAMAEELESNLNLGSKNGNGIAIARAAAHGGRAR